MNVRRIFILTWISFFLALIAAFALAQDFPGKPPEIVPLRKIEKQGFSNLESCLERAGKRAKDDARKRNTVLLRITAAPSDAKEFYAFLVVAEFKDGSIGCFQGGSEAEHDQWVTVDKDLILIVGEACARTPR